MTKHELNMSWVTLTCQYFGSVKEIDTRMKKKNPSTFSHGGNMIQRWHNFPFHKPIDCIKLPMVLSPKGLPVPIYIGNIHNTHNPQHYAFLMRPNYSHFLLLYRICVLFGGCRLPRINIILRVFWFPSYFMMLQCTYILSCIKSHLLLQACLML